VYQRRQAALPRFILKVRSRTNNDRESTVGELNRHWDEEHDRYVLNCLLDLVQEEFGPTTVQAFRRLALEGAKGADAAQELGLSVAAVYVAKSRVLQRIREEAEGLID
jgi:RNA polymerase sigma-70 factor, ECF subfamily